MTKRLFIAINLPLKVKEQVNYEVENHLKPLFDKKIHFVKLDNWHLTINFLGDCPEENLPRLRKKIDEAAETFNQPRICLEKIAYGPPKNNRKDKDFSMIWFYGSKQSSVILNQLSQKLSDSLERPVTAHVTLLRFGRSEKFPRILPQIEKNIQICFNAQSLDLMESTLNQPGGSEYSVIYSKDFNKK